MHSFSHLRLLLLGFIVVAVAACASGTTTPAVPAVTTNYDHSYDFSRVHKIAIQPVSRTTVSTINISDTQISRINAALTAELRQRGFEVVHSNAEADMFLVWRLVTEAKMSSHDLNSIGQYNCLNCAPGDSVQDPEYVKATLVVEMIDPIQLQSEWRATMVTRLRNQSDLQLPEANRQAAAEQLLADFPPAVNAP